MVNFEAWLNSFTRNVESIIQWLFLLILALAGFLIARGITARKEEGETSAAPSPAGPNPEFENILKQILERTQKLEAVTVQPGLSPEAAALAETQVQSLKKELAAREEELKAMKAAGTPDTKMSEEASKLSIRLKELESKLAEYEILEDDIADLSLYKEENSRLRQELSKIKGAPEPPPPPPAPSAAAAPAAQAPPADDIVAEFAQAVGAETQSAAAGAPAGEGPVTMQVPDTGNPMKDFEAAVKIEKKLAAPSAQAAAAKPAAAPGAADAESDDLFAEFSQPPEGTEGGLDTDKMMAEMAALVNIEPSSGSALDEGVDTEKMAAEAGNFNKR